MALRAGAGNVSPRLAPVQAAMIGCASTSSSSVPTP